MFCLDSRKYWLLTICNILCFLYLTAQYTKLKSSERKNREVIDPNGIDEQFNLDINMIRREDNPVDQIGPGWGLEKREGKSRSKRWRWISPTRGMKFRLVATLTLLVAHSSIVCLIYVCSTLLFLLLSQIPNGCSAFRIFATEVWRR